MHASKHEYDHLFPFGAIRDEQRKAIDFALDAFYEQGKRFVILEMGTGCGKSATAVTISRYMHQKEAISVTDSIAVKEDKKEPSGPLAGSYVLTTQKLLQEQYVKDFGEDRGELRSVKSSSNYQCQFHKTQSCSESRRVLVQMRKQLIGTSFWNCCQSRCPYKADKQEFVESTLSITNFAYFLSESMYAGGLKQRSLLIIDEAHNIESELGKHIEVTFSEKFAKTALSCKAPTLSAKPDPDKAMIVIVDWIKTKYKDAIEKKLGAMAKLLFKHPDVNSLSFAELSKQVDFTKKHYGKVTNFLSSFSPENWVMNIHEPENKFQGRRFEFKPVDVSNLAEKSLYRFGEKVLLLSATIIDQQVFCKTVGIPQDQVAVLRVPSPFPIENRPVHFMPIGKMSMDMINKTLPKMALAIQAILDQHPNEKGIIHCTSFKVSQFLHENVKSDRLLVHNSQNRDDVLGYHINTPKPTVLLSPSMMEGVDLADDSSRFQVICKVPFPYLGDRVINKRKERNKNWYPFQTAKSVIQALGRSIRNSSDHATSYILDEDWRLFFRFNRKMFPEDFVKSVKFG